MQKIIIYILGLISFINIVIAQPNIDRKRDYNWFTGYSSIAHSFAPDFGTTLTNFSYCEIQQNFKFNDFYLQITNLITFNQYTDLTII